MADGAALKVVERNRLRGPTPSARRHASGTPRTASSQLLPAGGRRRISTRPGSLAASGSAGTRAGSFHTRGRPYSPSDARVRVCVPLSVASVGDGVGDVRSCRSRPSGAQRTPARSCTGIEPSSRDPQGADMHCVNGVLGPSAAIQANLSLVLREERRGAFLGCRAYRPESLSTSLRSPRELLGARAGVQAGAAVPRPLESRHGRPLSPISAHGRFRYRSMSARHTAPDRSGRHRAPGGRTPLFEPRQCVNLATGDSRRRCVGHAVWAS
jgi:hypothetical protein